MKEDTKKVFLTTWGCQMDAVLYDFAGISQDDICE
jgi:hypothetical protein